MKKFTVTFLFGLLILAFGATAYGQPKLDFRASGFIDVVTNLYQNVTPGTFGGGIYGTVESSGVPVNGGLASPDPGRLGYNKVNSFLATRGRLKFDAIMEKNLSGTIFFEIDSTNWGESSPTGDQRNAAGFWNADRGAVEVKNLYFDFGIPYFGIPVPMTVRAGIQPLAVRPGMLIYTDGAGFTGGIDLAPVKLQPLWFKALEGRTYDADDVDIYGLIASANISTFTVGGYGLYYDMNTYPLAAVTGAATPSFRSSMWWFGVFADGKAGPVNLNFDFIYDIGDVQPRYSGGATGTKVDYEGWATRAKVDYPWEKFNFGVVGMYATGADKRATDSTGFPGRTTPFGTQTRRVDSYVVPPGSEEGFIFGESLVVYSSWVNRGTTGIHAQGSGTANNMGGIGGTWMAKAYGSYKATPWYKVTLQGMYIGDTTDHGDTLGTAVRIGTIPRDGDSIGWEFNLINEFQLYKNLSFVVGYGYLFAGSALKYNYPGTNYNFTPQNPWMLTTALTYNF
jgi:hypothetical protein